MNVAVLDTLKHIQDIPQSSSEDDTDHLNFNSPDMIALFYMKKKIPAQSLSEGEDVEDVEWIYVKLKGKDDRVLDLQIKYVHILTV